MVVDEALGYCVTPDAGSDGGGSGGSTSDAGPCVAGATRACPGASDLGECVSGLQTCTAGTWGTCTGTVGPALETCDALDNDCDGSADGAVASAACMRMGPPHVLAAACSAGACVATTCATGYEDCDGLFANGCEGELGTPAHCTSCAETCAWACESGGVQRRPRTCAR